MGMEWCLSPFRYCSSLWLCDFAICFLGRGGTQRPGTAEGLGRAPACRQASAWARQPALGLWAAA